MARPREFDTDQALRTAMRLFWERGFDGVSLTELADGMGIVRPSLQAAFGSKEDLYKRTLDLYARESMGFVTEALAGRTASEVCRLYLRGFSEILLDPKSPRGCFLVKSMMSCGHGATLARATGLAQLQSYEAQLDRRFRQAHRDGDLPKDVDARALAESLTTLANGLAMRVDMGATRAELDRVARHALKTLL